jgi:hypothetical protein
MKGLSRDCRNPSSMGNDVLNYQIKIPPEEITWDEAATLGKGASGIVKKGMYVFFSDLYQN